MQKFHLSFSVLILAFGLGLRSQTYAAIASNCSIYNENAPGPAPYQFGNPGSSDVRGFFQHFGPMAVYIQTHTGWPASVTLAQIALESGFGTSWMFNNANGPVGQMCIQKGTYWFHIGPQPRAYNVTGCVFGAGHWWTRFETVQDGVFGYIDNVLMAEGTESFYSRARNYIRALVTPLMKTPVTSGVSLKELLAKAHQEGVTIPVLNAAQAIDSLDNYEMPANRSVRYKAALRAMIAQWDLARFDRQTTCRWERMQ